MRVDFVCIECDEVLSRGKLMQHVFEKNHLYFRPVRVP